MVSVLAREDLGKATATTPVNGHSRGSAPEYPVGTVALYGPDDKSTTKIAAGVITSPTAEPIITRWVATDVTTSPKVKWEIQEFFNDHRVESVAAGAGNMGCPRGG